MGLLSGISRDSTHKRRSTGGKRKSIRMKRKFEMGRPPAMTKLGPKRVHEVRSRGGNLKLRALRLDAGNFSWGSETITRKTRLLTVLYNASNNELVRTNTLVKNCIAQVDATPFRQWYKQHYGIDLGKKKLAGVRSPSAPSPRQPSSPTQPLPFASPALLSRLISLSFCAEIDSSPFFVERQLTLNRTRRTSSRASTFRRSLLAAPRARRSSTALPSSSLPAVSSPASPLALARADAATDTSLRDLSSTFTTRRSTARGGKRSGLGLGACAFAPGWRPTWGGASSPANELAEPLFGVV